MKTIIQAGQIEKNYWSDLVRYRGLFYFLAWRDLLVRYKQTAVGVAWAVVRPLLTMVVFTVVFGRIAKLPSDGIPYPVMVFAAMLPWQFFSSALSEAGGSLVSNANLVSKVYFPRLILPTSAVIVAFVDFLVSCVILAVVMLIYQHPPTITIFSLPAFALLAFFAALGPGLLITALNVRFRDFRYIVPFIVQMGLYISPVGFSSSVVPEQWRLLYSLNPMVGIIDGFRWAICGAESSKIYLPGFCLSLAVVAVFMFVGIVFFRRTEQSFADVI